MPISNAIYQLTQIHPLKHESEMALESILKTFDYEKNTIFLKEGHVSRYIYFINKGLVRIFYYKQEKEITEWIACDKEFFLSIKSFYEQKPSILQFHAIENCQLVGIPYSDFLHLCSQFHDIESLHRKLITFSLLLSQERMDSIQFETARQRYEKFIALRPDIIKRVPLTYISSYLGITLETLSRIRGKNKFYFQKNII